MKVCAGFFHEQEFTPQCLYCGKPVVMAGIRINEDLSGFDIPPLGLHPECAVTMSQEMIAVVANVFELKGSLSSLT